MFRRICLLSMMLLLENNFLLNWPRGHKMELKRLSDELTVCKVKSMNDINLDAEFFFIGKTDEEISLVCKTEDTPVDTIEREDG